MLLKPCLLVLLTGCSFMAAGQDTSICTKYHSIAAIPPSSGQQGVLAGPIVTTAYSTQGTDLFSTFDSTGAGIFVPIPAVDTFWRNSTGSNGPLNRCGVWATTLSDNQSVGFSVCINIPADQDYYMGFGVDNYATLKIDAKVIIDQAATAGQENLNIWRVYPITLTKGKHYVEILGHNPYGPASIGFEIYQNTAAEIENATSYADLNVVFTSRDQIGKPLQDGDPTLTYSCPGGYALDYCSSNIPLCTKVLADTVALSVHNPLPDCRLDSVDITSATLTRGSSPGLRYTYWLDSPETAPILNPNRIKLSGTYYIQAIDDSGCAVTHSIQVVVLAQPDTVFSVTQPSQCLRGNQFAFTYAGGAATVWTFGDGVGSSAQSPTHSYSSPGKFALKLVVTGSDGCKDSSTRSIQVYPAPQPVISPAGSFSLCQGDTIPVTARGGHVYQWTINGVPFSVDSSIGVYASGQYTLDVINSFGCDSTVTFAARVLQKSYAQVDIALCQGAAYYGHGISGVYVDTYPAANGCDSIRTLHLVVNPVYSTVIDTTVCSGLSVYGYANAGVHTDHFTSVSGCDSARILDLNVLPLPDPRLGSPDTGVCNGQVIRLSPGSFDSYVWQDGSAASAYMVSQPGTYTVTVTNTCGEASTSIVVHAEHCVVVFPSAFTPGLGVDNVFKALNGYDVRGYILSIFDRYGQKVFHTTDVLSGWDGTIGGRQAPAGAYVWFCQYSPQGSAEVVRLKGTVVVER